MDGTEKNIGWIKRKVGPRMFLKPQVLNRLMKQAYKTGLTVARTNADWLYIAGSCWEISAKKEFVSKRTMGDLIALVGELPEQGERFTATKEGNQMEAGLPLAVRDEAFREKRTLTISDVLLIGSGGTAQRLLQDDDTGNIYVVNNVFIEIIDNDMIMEDRGEYPVAKPSFTPTRGILWQNNVCRLRALFRSDVKNDKILENLKGVDITPEEAGEEKNEETVL